MLCLNSEKLFYPRFSDALALRASLNAKMEEFMNESRAYTDPMTQDEIENDSVNPRGCFYT